MKNVAVSKGCFAHVEEVEGEEFDLYAIKGKTKDAFIKSESYLRNAIEYNARYTAAYRNLGALYVKMGRKLEAREYLKIAFRLEPYDKELEAYIQQLR
jgi:tetratricopeptide (TPR) repeat protein